MHVVNEEARASRTNDKKREERVYDDHLTPQVDLERVLVDAIT